MWICTNRGFVSVVEHRANANLVCVRARRASDLVNFTGSELIEQTDDADYRFRCVTTKENLKSLLMAEVNRIDYDNFKDSVPAEDDDLAHFYGEVWSSGIGNLDPGWIKRRKPR